MLTKAWLAYRRFGQPGKHIRYLGVTGTDGKSTTCACVYHTMKEAGVKVGIISTVLIDVGDGVQQNETHMTSVDHSTFWSSVVQAEKNGLTHMVVEVSSHALYQYRTRPLRFMGVGITNLSPEHLDFHRTMEHYATTKAELFGRLLAGGVGVMPLGFKYGKAFSAKNQESRKTFGYTQQADIYVSHITESPTLSFDLHYQDEQVHVDSQMLGQFNSENMMVASVLAMHEGLSLTHIQHGLESFAGLPGRQELVKTQQGVTAMIDFAVTPDALQTLYSATRQMGYTRLIAVFGATGNRDQTKRPKMGAVAAQLCDIVIITEDENYHEDGREIMKEVVSGISDVSLLLHEPSPHTPLPTASASLPLGEGLAVSRCEVWMIQERREAIGRGLALAQPGDVVIVTGMANYTSRAMNEGSVSWNEREVIQEEMRKQGMSVEQ